MALVVRVPVGPGGAEVVFRAGQGRAPLLEHLLRLFDARLRRRARLPGAGGLPGGGGGGLLEGRELAAAFEEAGGPGGVSDDQDAARVHRRDGVVLPGRPGPSGGVQGLGAVHPGQQHPHPGGARAFRTEFAEQRPRPIRFAGLVQPEQHDPSALRPLLGEPSAQTRGGFAVLHQQRLRQMTEIRFRSRKPPGRTCHAL